MSDLPSRNDGKGTSSFNKRVGKGDKGRKIECPRCGRNMTKMQPCHLICSNCGAHLDCSDKGSFW